MSMRTLVATVIAIPAFLLVMRFNLHMLQLNGYKNLEHIRWLKKNISKQVILLSGFLLGIFSVFKNSVVLEILICAVWLIVCRYYYFLKKKNLKKILVYTKRAKRIIFTNVLLMVIFIIAIYTLTNNFVGLTAILISIESLLLVVSNIFNKPLEMVINKHFINDAKKKLKKANNLKIIGITGSFGKTSFKYYLQALLQEKYNVLITPESYNTPMGIVKTIRESLKPIHEIFVCEMGARYVGDIKEICDIVHPNFGVITSIGPQHLETFGGIENIIRTKFELADSLTEEGVLFLNRDNTYIREHSEKKYNKVWYGTGEKGVGYYVNDVILSQLGTEFTVISPKGEKEVFQMKLIGEYNIINVVGAIAVANILGIALDELKGPVRRIQQVEHRMQMIEKENVTIIDDSYNSNPIGSKAAIDTLAMFDGIKILITPGMVELGKQEEEYNYEFGKYAAKVCDYIFLIGKKRVFPIEKAIIESGFAPEKCKIFDALVDAMECAYSIQGNGHKYILLENDLPDNY